MTAMPTPKQILEAVLFASDVPVGIQVLAEVIGDRSVPEVRELLAEMARSYDREERGVVLAEIAGGFQLLSRKECAPWGEQMLRARRESRLSNAARDALAIG